MTVPQSDKPSEVLGYIYDLLIAPATINTLGLEDVFKGDQNLIPKVPSACVFVGDYARALVGAPFRTDNVFSIYIMLYHAGIEDLQLVYEECLQHAEAIMELLHTDKTMGGNVIHGYVTAMEPGYVQKKRQMYATRITWTGLTRTMT